MRHRRHSPIQWIYSTALMNLLEYHRICRSIIPFLYHDATPLQFYTQPPINIIPLTLILVTRKSYRIRIAAGSFLKFNLDEVQLPRYHEGRQSEQF